MQVNSPYVNEKYSLSIVVLKQGISTPTEVFWKSKTHWNDVNGTLDIQTNERLDMLQVDRNDSAFWQYNLVVWLRVRFWARLRKHWLCKLDGVQAKTSKHTLTLGHQACYTWSRLTTVKQREQTEAKRSGRTTCSTGGPDIDNTSAPRTCTWYSTRIFCNKKIPFRIV